MKITNISQAALVGLSLLGGVNAHAAINDPKPIDYPPTGDTTYNRPLAHDMSDFPCKNLHRTGKDLSAVTTWKAGGEGSFTVDATNAAQIAAHKGGSCQASMSFDRGVTWVVLHSFIGDCPRGTNGNAVANPKDQTYKFNIPDDVPSGNALFGWTWFAVTADRDMYMNCAVVNIQSSVPPSETYANSKNLPPPFVGAIGGNGSPGCINPDPSNLEFPMCGNDTSRVTYARDNGVQLPDPYAAPKGNCGTKETGGGVPLKSNCKEPGKNLNTDTAPGSGGSYGGSPAVPPSSPPSAGGSYNSPVPPSSGGSYDPPADGAGASTPPAGGNDYGKEGNNGNGNNNNNNSGNNNAGSPTVTVTVTAYMTVDAAACSGNAGSGSGSPPPAATPPSYAPGTPSDNSGSGGSTTPGGGAGGSYAPGTPSDSTGGNAGGSYAPGTPNDSAGSNTGTGGSYAPGAPPAENNNNNNGGGSYNNGTSGGNKAVDNMCGWVEGKMTDEMNQKFCKCVRDEINPGMWANFPKAMQYCDERVPTQSAPGYGGSQPTPEPAKPGYNRRKRSYHRVARHRAHRHVKA